MSIEPGTEFTWQGHEWRVIAQDPRTGAVVMIPAHVPVVGLDEPSARQLVREREPVAA